MDKAHDNMSDVQNNVEDNTDDRMDDMDYMADIEEANDMLDIICMAEMEEMDNMDDEKMFYAQNMEGNVVDMFDNQNNMDANALDDEFFEFDDEAGSDYTLDYSSDEDIFDDLMDYDSSSDEEIDIDNLDEGEKSDMPRKVNFSVLFKNLIFDTRT